MSVEELTQDRMEAALTEDLLDIGIGFTGEHLPDIACEGVFVEALSVVVSYGHADIGQQSWLQQPLVLLNSGFATRRYIDEYFRSQAVKPLIAVEANSISAIIEIVRSTQLATILPSAIAQVQPGLQAVPLRPPLPQRTAALLSRKGGYRSAACRAFVDLVRAQPTTD